MSIATNYLDEMIVNIDENIKYYDTQIVTYKKHVEEMENARATKANDRKEIIKAIGKLEEKQEASDG